MGVHLWTLSGNAFWLLPPASACTEVSAQTADVKCILCPQHSADAPRAQRGHPLGTGQVPLRHSTDARHLGLVSYSSLPFPIKMVIDSCLT